VSEPTELSAGTTQMAWLVENLTANEPYTMAWLRVVDGDWANYAIDYHSFTASADHEVAFWNLTVDEHACDVYIESDLYGGGQYYEYAVGRNLTAPCEQVGDPYAEYLMYDGDLDQWVSIPGYIGDGDYEMAVIMGNLTEGDELTLAVHIRGFDDGGDAIESINIFSGGVADGSGCDDINISSDSNCVQNGTFTVPASGFHVLYWNLTMTLEVCNFQLWGSLYHSSNATEVSVQSYGEHVTEGPCDVVSTTTVPYFELFALDEDAGYYQVDP
ncbi:uncharacterized protein METZ01_LOCUS279936, partial [marine metagenome]